MIRLLPISTTQSITFLPRNFDFIDDYNAFVERVRNEGGTFEYSDCAYDSLVEKVTINIRQDGEGDSVVLNDVVPYINKDFVYADISTNIFIEDSIYSITIENNGLLLYRDMIYVTSQTDTNEYHTLNTNKYVENSSDNEYITFKE